jgi:hypothetical protein
MDMSVETRLANFVIGGTEKAGTTSVFNWLSAHPHVCASSRKETDFFRADFTGDPVTDTRRYASYFERCARHAAVLMEASPGYLGEAATVAPRMRSLVPGAKVLFILREPIGRMYSSYHFHRSKLNLPPSVTFEDYVRRCLDFERSARRPEELGLDEWYLKVLRFGCYADLIATFRRHLPVDNIKVMFFEKLQQDARAFMVELSGFVGIDADFWSRFDFRKSNVTFSGRNKRLHLLAMKVNSAAEPMMRRYPVLKQSLVRCYKAVNQEREGYDPMSPVARQMLIDFYAPGTRSLQQQLGVALPEAWLPLTRAAIAA